MKKPQLAEGFEGQRFLTIPHTLIERMRERPFSQDLQVFCIGYFPCARFHYVNRPQGSSEYILIYSKEGSGWIQVGEEKHTLTKDEFIVIPKSTPHAYGSDEKSPWSIYWIHFDGSKAAFLSQGLCIPSGITPADDSRIAERIDLFEEIFALLNQNLSIETLEYVGLVLQHLIGTFRYVSIYRKGNIRKNNDNDAILKIIHFMEENIENHLSVEQMATIGNLSKSHLYRRFLDETGQSPLDYFIHMKIKKACMLLTQTSMTISQIAFKLGFHETQYFARTFKKAMGLSAGEFRKEYLQVSQ